MHYIRKIIEWVRAARFNTQIKYPIRTVLVILLFAGMWVATQPLTMPEGFNVSDKFIHAFVFFGFALIMDVSVSRRPFWFWKGMPLFFYGVFIEVLQYFVPERSFSIADMLANVSGIILYYLLKYSLRLWAFRK